MFFFPPKKAQDVRQAMVNSTTGKKVPPAHAKQVFDNEQQYWCFRVVEVRLFTGNLEEPIRLPSPHRIKMCL